MEILCGWTFLTSGKPDSSGTSERRHDVPAVAIVQMFSNHDLVIEMSKDASVG